MDDASKRRSSCDTIAEIARLMGETSEDTEEDALWTANETLERTTDDDAREGSARWVK